MVAIHPVEAHAQGVGRHQRRLRRFWTATNGALGLLLAALSGCRNPSQAAETRQLGGTAIYSDVVEPHPTASAAETKPSLPPLRGAWLEQLSDGTREIIVTPPLGVISPALLVLGIHGAGDRPEWSCGGWRLGTQASAFVVCPRGVPLSPGTFAWASSKMIAERAAAALAATSARFEPYIQHETMIYAGFSQGANLAEPFLRKNAARFRIAILAEGGYATAQSPAFAAAYRAGGGRRVVLVCGTPSCFRSATASKKVLERAGLETLVVGDEMAGHNLNERMQQALQSSWPEISAPPR